MLLLLTHQAYMRTDRQTRQTDKTDRQKDKTDRQDTQTDIQTHRQTGRHTVLWNLTCCFF